MPRSTKSKPKLRPSQRFEFAAIGTAWSIDLYEPLKEVAALERAIAVRSEQFDQNYSRFRKDSLITRMSQQAGRYRLPPDAQPLLDLYERLYAATDGEMTPLIGQPLADAGYDAAYSLVAGRVVVPPAWDEVLAYRFPELTLKRPALLDFGAAGKGYLVDIIAALLHDHGVESFCINAGGDMAHRSRSNQAITVGLEHPDDPTQVIGTVALGNQSLCGSAGNRRAWGRYHHILSPSKLASPRHIKAVWVVADSTLLADGLTTALYFVSADRLKRLYTFEYALVRDNDSFEASEALKGAFFT